MNRPCVFGRTQSPPPPPGRPPTSELARRASLPRSLRPVGILPRLNEYPRSIFVVVGRLSRLITSAGLLNAADTDIFLTWLLVTPVSWVTRRVTDTEFPTTNYISALFTAWLYIGRTVLVWVVGAYGKLIRKGIL